MPWLSVLKCGAPRRWRWTWRPLSQGWKCSSICWTGSPSGWAAGSTRRRSCASGRRRSAVSTGCCPGPTWVLVVHHPRSRSRCLCPDGSVEWRGVWTPGFCPASATYLPLTLGQWLEFWEFHFLLSSLQSGLFLLSLMSCGIPRNNACPLWRLSFYFPYICEVE